MHISSWRAFSQSALSLALRSAFGLTTIGIFGAEVLVQPAAAIEASTAGATQIHIAQSRSPQRRTARRRRRIRFRTNVPPPVEGTPRAPYGTGSRGDCPPNEELPPLKALAGDEGLELTVSDRPSFWIYVPYGQTVVSEATFSLQQGDAEIYQQAVSVPAEPGVIEVALPPTLPPLAVGESYRWYLEVVCPQADLADRPTPETVSGIVQRVAPSQTLLDELAIAQSPLDKVAAYAENNIWYETITGLTQLRQAYPEDRALTELWQDLLSDPAVGLADWAEVSIARYNQFPTNVNGAQ